MAFLFRCRDLPLRLHLFPMVAIVVLLLVLLVRVVVRRGLRSCTR